MQEKASRIRHIDNHQNAYLLWMRDNHRSAKPSMLVPSAFFAFKMAGPLRRVSCHIWILNASSLFLHHTLYGFADPLFEKLRGLFEYPKLTILGKIVPKS